MIPDKTVMKLSRDVENEMRQHRSQQRMVRGQRMKVIIDIKETPRGDVALEIASDGASTATRKEMCYAVNIKDLMKMEMPKLCKALGGKGAIFGTGKPENS